MEEVSEAWAERESWVPSWPSQRLAVKSFWILPVQRPFCCPGCLLCALQRCHIFLTHFQFRWARAAWTGAHAEPPDRILSQPRQVSGLSLATHLPQCLKAPATSQPRGPGGVSPRSIFCGLLRVQRGPSHKEEYPTNCPPGISGSAAGITPGSGLSWPLRASLAPVSNGWASWQCSTGLRSP